MEMVEDLVDGFVQKTAEAELASLRSQLAAAHHERDAAVARAGRLEEALQDIADFEPIPGKGDPHTQIACNVKAIARDALAEWPDTDGPG